MTLIKVGGAVKRFNYDDVEVLLQRIVDGDLTINLYFKRQNRAISIGDVIGLKPACLMSDDELGATKAEYQKFNEWKSELQSEKSDWFILHLDTLMEAVNGGQELGVQDFAGMKINRSIKLKTKFDGELPEGVYFCTQAPKLTYNDLWVDEDELKASLQGEIIKTEIANTMQSDQPNPQSKQFKDSDAISEKSKSTLTMFIQALHKAYPNTSLFIERLKSALKNGSKNQLAGIVSELKETYPEIQPAKVNTAAQVSGLIIGKSTIEKYLRGAF